MNWGRMLTSPSAWILLIVLLAAFVVGKNVPVTWTSEQVTLDVQQDESGKPYYRQRGQPIYLDHVVPYLEAQLHPDRIQEANDSSRSLLVTAEYTTRVVERDGVTKTQYLQLLAKRHWGVWSLLPAFVAITMCWLCREPITALLGGIVAGAFILGQYDITEQVLLPAFMTKSAAGVFILYLWLLGGLLGIWTRTGAAQAFADYMSTHFVRGPKSARFVAWLLGIVFFQGGTISTVLVGTSVKPLADKQRISHEELSYIVDSTASPIASQLAFNAWPGYVQTFIFVAGVPWLATEADRIAFFFKSVPFCFYAIFAVLGTFLLSLDKAPFVNRQLRQAIHRSRQTGELDAPDAQPLSAKELQSSNVPEGYRPHVFEFFLPLIILIGIAIGTFIIYGSPQVRWAFGAAVILAGLTALGRGMRLVDLISGLADGLKGVVLGSVILLLAITLGLTTKELGAGSYLVALLGDAIPYWCLPVLLQLLTIFIAFSTGTSWGTYAVTFPLAMPLTWAIANNQGLEHPMFFMTICFAAVMDGSVFGDQCSPISDTTILSSMCCGCDLMDHVKTQIPQALQAAILAAIGWTACALLFA